MAHNNYIRAGGIWVNGDVPTGTEFSAIDHLLFKGLNGDDGGTWAPAAVITIGGSGVHVTGPGIIDDLEVVTSLTVDSGATASIDSGATFHAVAGSTFTIDAAGHFSAGITVTDAGAQGAGLVVFPNTGAGNKDGVDAVGRGTGIGVVGVGGAGNAGGVKGTGHGSEPGVLGENVGGTGDGVKGTGGTGGRGVYGLGGTNAAGVEGDGNGTGYGGAFIGGASSTGLFGGAGPGSGLDGVHGLGDGAGAGGAFLGGTTGAGLKGTAGSGGNGNGVEGAGHGTGAGVSGLGGATGNGVEGTAGSASNVGVKGTGGTSGYGVSAQGGGTNGGGLAANGKGTGVAGNFTQVEDAVAILATRVGASAAHPTIYAFGDGAGVTAPALKAKQNNGNTDAAIVVEKGTVVFTGASPAKTADPGSDNTLCGALVPKAWATILTTGAGGLTGSSGFIDGVNVSFVTITGGNGFLVTFARAMASANSYAVVATCFSVAGITQFMILTKDTGSFSFAILDAINGVMDPHAAQVIAVDLVVFARQ